MSFYQAIMRCKWADMRFSALQKSVRLDHQIEMVVSQFCPIQHNSAEDHNPRLQVHPNGKKSLLRSSKWSLLIGRWQVGPYCPLHVPSRGWSDSQRLRSLFEGRSSVANWFCRLPCRRKPGNRNSLCSPESETTVLQWWNRSLTLQTAADCNKSRRFPPIWNVNQNQIKEHLK